MRIPTAILSNTAGAQEQRTGTSDVLASDGGLIEAALELQSADASRSDDKHDHRLKLAIGERDALAHANVELVRTNAELVRRLPDHLDGDDALAQQTVVLGLQHTNLELADRLAQRIAEGDEAVKEADRLHGILSKELKRQDEVNENVAQRTLASMDDITWGFVELTRSDNENAEKVHAEYETRIKDQIGQRLEQFDGGPRTLEEKPTRRNSLDRIWGKTVSD